MAAVGQTGYQLISIEKAAYKKKYCSVYDAMSNTIISFSQKEKTNREKNNEGCIQQIFWGSFCGALHPGYEAQFVAFWRKTALRSKSTTPLAAA